MRVRARGRTFAAAAFTLAGTQDTSVCTRIDTHTCTQTVGHRSLSCWDTRWLLLHTSLQCACVCVSNSACLFSISSFSTSVTYLALTSVSEHLSQTCCCCSPVIILRPQHPQQRTAGVPSGQLRPRSTTTVSVIPRLWSYIQMY